MSIPFSRAPHIEGANASLRSPEAPNAALLIDFDNVTMGMRSDLSKELKTLVGSDVIKGKVTVQRAYADWRRYPQYIVPLSEASIDLIFAPAYGSNKKNATDIRMAIDGIELVFTRPEIGTFILLTGDSDFSSLVLKLKEYGKYVIGVGIQESSSDILVQNCDEYYSYTSLSGLRKADEGTGAPTDPWSLVGRAAEQMSRRGDVMRSDRLKQVMLDLDPSFDEKGFGFSKFSRFVSEASRKGLIETRKMENGQYEILPVDGSKGAGPDDSGTRSKKPAPKRSSRGSPNRKGETSDAKEDADPGQEATKPVTASLEAGHALLREAVSGLLRDLGTETVRDSDVKRRMLALQHGFDEGELGFPKFSRFLKQAHDQGIVRLHPSEEGHNQVELGETSVSTAPSQEASVDLAALRLPVGRESVVKYLSNSYGGVGRRTAETLADELGERIFEVLQTDPSRVEALLPPARAERVLAGWKADYQRRSSRQTSEGSDMESQRDGAVEAQPPGEEATESPGQEVRARRGRRTRRRPEVDG